MSKLTMFLPCLAVLTIAVGLGGCAGRTESTPPASDQTHPHDHSDHAEQGSHGGHSEYEEALAQLSKADRALAEKQKVCPVSGEPLGSMGKPYKVTVKGQDVLLCCQGCEVEIKGNPDK